MARNSDSPKVVLAITESCPLDRLWLEVLDQLRSSDGDVTVLLLRDDRWQRAASLPFTREISRLGGTSDFTRQRADEVSRAALANLRRVAEALAGKSGLECTFAELASDDDTGIPTLIASEHSVFIAHSIIRNLPFYASVRSADCRIVLLDDADESADEDNG